MEVELAADPAGQERLRPAIFGIADDRVADRRHVRAQLVGAAGQRLQLDPGGAVAGAVDHPPAGLGRKPVLLADVHLLAAGARLLGERRIDHALVAATGRRRPAPNRPCARCGRKRPWRNGRPRARVRATSSAPDVSLSSRWTSLGRPPLVGQPVEQPVEMLVGLGPALRREPRRLVEHEGVRVLVDHHVADELRFFLGQRLALGLRPRRSRRRRFGRRHADLLPGLDPVAGHRALAVEPQLPGPRPARDEVEADVGHVPLEPAVEADAVVVLVDGEGARVGHRRARLANARPRVPPNSRTPARCSLRISFAALRPFPQAGVAVLLRAADPPALPGQPVRLAHDQHRKLGLAALLPLRRRRSRAPCTARASWAG